MPSIPRPAVQRRPSEGSVVVVGVRGEKREIVRGPWDHSGSIGVVVDVDVLLQPLSRAMVVLRGI
jgi:hypothetical protein